MPITHYKKDIQNIQEPKKRIIDIVTDPENPNYFDFYRENTVKQFDKDGKVISEWKTVTSTDRVEVENRIRTSVQELVNFYESYMYPVRMEAIKNYSLHTWDRERLQDKERLPFRTNEKVPITKAVCDRVVNNLYSAWYNIRVLPQTQSVAEYAEIMQDVVYRTFSAADLDQTTKDSSQDAVTVGNGFWRYGLRKWDKELMYEKKMKEGDVDEVTKTTVQSLSGHPYTQHVSPFCIFGHVERNFYKSPVVYRERLSIESVLSSKKEFFKLNEEQLAQIIHSPSYVSNKNYDKIRLIRYLDWDHIKNKQVEDILEDKMFQIEAKHELVEYIERRDNDNLQIMINGYVVYDYENPKSYKSHPFVYVSHTREPWMRTWDGIWTKLIGTQRQYDSMNNMMFDLAKINAAPMFVLPESTQIKTSWWVDMQWKLTYEPYWFVTISGAPWTNITRLNMPSPNEVNFKMMADLLEMTNFVVPPTTYNQLQWVSRSATDSQYRQESLRDIVRPLGDSVNNAYKIMIKNIIMELKDKLPDEFIINVIRWEYEKDYEFVNVTKEMLEGNYLFETEFESLKEASSVVDKANFVEFINVLPSIANDPITSRPLIDFEELNKYAAKLYKMNPDVLMSEEKFKEKVEEIQKEQQKMQQQQQPEPEPAPTITSQWLDTQPAIDMEKWIEPSSLWDMLKNIQS